MTTPRIAPLAAALLLAAGCGGGSSDPAATFAVKGTVSGLAGSNLVLHLGPAAPGQDLAVPAAGPFAFPGALADGSAYEVTVKTQPSGPTQACVVSGGSGTIAGADASVTVTCTTSTFPVGGTVTGLAGGTLLLRNGGGDDLEVVADGPFAFATPVASGATFSVTVAQQPAAPPQRCAVAGGAGTVVAGPVTSVVVTCEAADKPVAGSLSGLAGATGVVLQVNGAHDTTLTANGPFEVPTGLASGTAWALTVKTQPTQPWQTCTVTGGSGTMGPTGAGGVEVTCATDAFAVGGTVSGLLQAGLSVRLSVGGAAVETVEPAGDGSLAFTQTALSGQAYLVEVVASPPTQVCTVTAAGGVVAGAPVGDVAVGCACAPGLASCSQLVQDGCEVQTLVDPLHCGGCGRACSALLPNTAASTCAAGQCEVAACSNGFDDCGPAAGCETPVSADPANCGACGHVCTPPPNATAGCADATCGVGTCTAGFGNCNAVAADGCETDLRTTVAHCGGCGNVCALANVLSQACAAGQCAVGTCTAGFGNCDGLAANGCEANLATDPSNCGACNATCSYPNAAGVCTAGTACSMGACDAGWDDCSAAAGCETQVAQDPLNCGACNVACPSTNGTAACLASACTMSACNPGWGDCRGAAVAGCETNLTSDAANCGSCGFACAAGQICGGSTCVAPPSCRAILALAPSSLDGVYTIDPDGAGGAAAVDVWCDMTTDGGGWTFFAHVNGDYQAGRLFELDLGSYDPNRGDPNASYGLGAKVYQRIGATELMVTLDVVDTLAARNADRFVVYQFAPNAPAFDTGPVPSLAPGALFKYRTHFDPLADGIINPDFFEDVWAPYTAEPDPFVGGFMGVAPLTLLNGTGTVGTFWGSGMAPPGTPGVDTSGHDSWWYAR